MRLLWEDRAWEDYLYWQMQDNKTLKRINGLIKDIQRDTFAGIGKPEPLKENLAGLWSRRIDDTNRIIMSRMESFMWFPAEATTMTEHPETAKEQPPGEAISHGGLLISVYFLLSKAMVSIARRWLSNVILPARHGRIPPGTRFSSRAFCRR